MKAHLERIIGHLSIVEDLMFSGSITPETMLLAASVGEEDRPVLATFTEDVPNGARLK